MKVKTALLVSLLIFVAGIVLMIIHSFDVFTSLIIAMGIVFIVPGIINIASLSTTRQENRNKAKVTIGSRFQTICGLISGVGSVIMGISMIGWSELFLKFLPMIFGTILILGGCFHACAMGMAFRPIRLPLWLYILPILLVALGLSIIFVDKAILLPCHIVLMTGIGLVIFAINAFIELWFTRKFNTPVKSTNDPDVIDVEAVE